MIRSQVDYERLTISDGTSMIDFVAISALSQLEITERERNDIGIDGDF